MAEFIIPGEGFFNSNDEDRIYMVPGAGVVMESGNHPDKMISYSIVDSPAGQGGDEPGLFFGNG